MNAKIFGAVFSIFLAGGALAFSQSLITFEGDVYIKDNLETELQKEGNLRIDGNVLITEADNSSFANGRNSIAIGNRARVHNDGSIAISVEDNGYIANAYSKYSLAIGRAAKAGKDDFTGGHNLAFGDAANAEGNDGSLAIGRYSYSGGASGLAFGAFAHVKQNWGIALGGHSRSEGWMAFAIGYESQAIGGSTAALGYNAKAIAGGSTAIGLRTETHSTQSAAFGYELKSGVFGETLIGRCNDPEEYAGNSAAWRDGQALFVIGNGKSSSDRANALIMKTNGDTTLKGELTANKFITKEAAGGISMGIFGMRE